MEFDPVTNPDVQEALSRRYSNEIIMILALKSGKFAVFNAGRDLCGFVDQPEAAWTVWFRPAVAPPIERRGIDLDELGLT